MVLPLEKSRPVGDKDDASEASSIIFLQRASLKESAAGVVESWLKRVVNWDDAVGVTVFSWARTDDAKEGRLRWGV